MFLMMGLSAYFSRFILWLENGKDDRKLMKTQINIFAEGGGGVPFVRKSPPEGQVSCKSDNDVSETLLVHAN